MQVIVAPPLYRCRPYWYRAQLPEIATQFSSCFSQDRPPNLHVLPSFINQDCLDDGVLLTPVAGLHYVLHLFDQSEALLNLATANEAQKSETAFEAARYHDDRIAYIEHDHALLCGKVNRRIAVDAEFSDWVLNRSEEDWVTIRGMPRIGSGLSSQEWQVEAKRQVRELIRLVLQVNKTNLNVDVLLVTNPWRKRLTGPTLYNVRLSSAGAAKRLREIYSGFFRHVNPVKKPSSLKTVSLRNKITHNSEIRIAIMRQLAENYVSSNPGASYKMRGYESRPLVTIFPPPKSTNSRPQNLSFMQAVTSLPVRFSDENLIRIFMVVGNSERDQLRELFVVLNDDDHDRCLEMVKKHHEERREDNRRGPERRQDRSSGHQGHPGPTSSHVGFTHGSGEGMEQEASLLRSLRKGAPPPLLLLEVRNRRIFPKVRRRPTMPRGRSPLPPRGSRMVKALILAPGSEIGQGPTVRDQGQGRGQGHAIGPVGGRTSPGRSSQDVRPVHLLRAREPAQVLEALGVRGRRTRATRRIERRNKIKGIIGLFCTFILLRD